ncbi:TPR end-of-group domain-containing protein [Lignipirellula cremea]|uniref:Tetratricopeptide repeat protein n=1 Tax=Lignipirellula cremea TaxID=2528010 RepID=A0A518DW64_9BACT|nr:hypothetical protein [Lignipirellula cremea]QDU96076.1 Tetratricopeptide repeat protein [Lignipirellula cremea]
MTVPATDLNRIRRRQLLSQAEGYLELILGFNENWTLPADVRDPLALRALEAIDTLEQENWRKSHVLFLKGQTLRAMGQYGAALIPLAEASDLAPRNLHIHLAMAWCHKRVNALSLAISDLENALEIDSEQAIVHYNLACYWSLAKNPASAARYLGQAFDLDPDYREMVAGESDFDPIRHHPAFQQVIGLVV